MPRKKKPRHGGRRPGAGRPPKLDDPVSRTWTLEQRQIDAVLRWRDQRDYGTRGDSRALRDLVEIADLVIATLGASDGFRIDGLKTADFPKMERLHELLRPGGAS